MYFIILFTIIQKKFRTSDIRNFLESSHYFLFMAYEFRLINTLFTMAALTCTAITAADTLTGLLIPDHTPDYKKN